MFSFFKKKPVAPDPALPPLTPSAFEPLPATTAPAPSVPEPRSWLDKLRGTPADNDDDLPQPTAAAFEPNAGPATLAPTPEAEPRGWLDRLRGVPADSDAPAGHAPPAAVDAVQSPAERRRWLDKLRGGLRKTGSGIAVVFTGTRIDEALYEDLEAALLMADAGARATEYLLMDLKWRVKDDKSTDPRRVKSLLADAIADLLRPLEKGLSVGEQVPTVLMVVGVNGAGKTTTIGKLTRHLADAGQKVLLAAGDTFRAAAREQLAVWARRNDAHGQGGVGAAGLIEIVGQEGGDPASVTFDAVVAGKARGCDVVIADTAGRLTTQLHLMEELKKIHRTIGKAQRGAPHEVLLVIDGNTGQNALSQVQAFDAALGLTGLVITKLDGTAKGGVLAAIALWSRDRVRNGGTRLPVYFVGVGEKLEDLQTFDAEEFAQALLGG